VLPAAILWKIIDLLKDLVARRRPRDGRVGPDPAVDPMQPVTNPELLAAIDYHARCNTLETENAMLLAMAKAVYVVPAHRTPAAVIRPDGVWVIPPGSGIRLWRPDLGGGSHRAVIGFTDEDSMLAWPDTDAIQLAYARELFDEGMRSCDVVVINREPQANVSITPDLSRKVRGLLGGAAKPR
jgi:hypothetical protein